MWTGGIRASVATYGLPGMEWEVQGLSTQRVPLLGQSWVRYNPRVQGSVEAGVGATAVTLQLWQAPRIYVDASGVKKLQPFSYGTEN